MNYYQVFKIFYQEAARKMCGECKDFVKENSKILDLGCGSAIVANEFQKFFKGEVLGIDIKDSRIFPIPFRTFNGADIPFDEDSFDIVLISYVLHHSKDPESLLKEAKRVGKMIIIFEDLPEGIFGKTYCFLHWLTWNLFFGKSPKFNFHTEKEWEEIFKNLELKIISKKNFLMKRKIFVLEKGVS